MLPILLIFSSEQFFSAHFVKKFFRKIVNTIIPHQNCVFFFNYPVMFTSAYSLVFDFSVLQIKQNLDITIIDDLAPEKDEYFEVVLSEPTGGAKVGYINRILITISNDDGMLLIP